MPLNFTTEDGCEVWAGLTAEEKLSIQLSYGLGAITARLSRGEVQTLRNYLNARLAESWKEDAPPTT